MSKTNTGLVEYCKAQVGLPYWYGTYGQTATASLYKSKKEQYPSYYTADDFTSQYGKRVHDCVGLIKGYLWSDSITSKPTYVSSQDKSASGMYSASETKGKISTFPAKLGQLVYKGTSVAKISHVGVYDGAGYVYEAKGHAYGVVKTKFSSSDWQYWSQCVYITDDTETPESVTETTTDTATYTGSTITASESAKSYIKSLAGTYRVTAKGGLNIRDGAGTSKAVLVTLPYNSNVRNYGYYTSVSGSNKWMYVQFTYNGIKYTGFASSSYLTKV